VRRITTIPIAVAQTQAGMKTMARCGGDTPATTNQTRNGTATAAAKSIEPTTG
jgi:hypothetical protein